MVKSLDKMTLKELKEECARRKLPAKECRKKKADLLKYLQDLDASKRGSSKRKTPARHHKRELEYWKLPELKEECKTVEKASKCNKMTKEELINLLQYEHVAQKFYEFLPTIKFSEKELEKTNVDNLRALCKGTGVSDKRCDKMTKKELIKVRLQYQKG